MSLAYSNLAQFYDLCIDVDYQEWVGYLLSLSLRYHHIPQQILDLGCGTGNLTLPLARKGYDLTGVDLSPEMIAEAKDKIHAEGLEIEFFVHDMRNLYLPGREFDTVISGCDVLNYLTTEADLQKTFAAVGKLLKSGGLFLFDLNSALKLQEIYGEQSYADLRNNFGYFWDNKYHWDQQICEMELTFFVKTSSGLYQRVTEKHWQKLWFPEDIVKVAQRTGFKVLNCYDFLSTNCCKDTSERWQFILRKEK